MDRDELPYEIADAIDESRCIVMSCHMRSPMRLMNRDEPCSMSMLRVYPYVDARTVGGDRAIFELLRHQPPVEGGVHRVELAHVLRVLEDLLCIERLELPAARREPATSHHRPSSEVMTRNESCSTCQRPDEDLGGERAIVPHMMRRDESPR